MKILPALFMSFLWTSFAQTQFSFPFQTGDRWVYDFYSAFSGFPVNRITFPVGNDTLMPNHQTYKPFMSFYLRTDGSKVYQFSSYDSSEFVRYDFSKQVGDTVSIVKQGNFSYVILLHEEYSMALFDTTSRRVLTYTGGPIWDLVADSFGIMKLTYGTDNWYQLVGAIISGHTYGDVTDVPMQNPALPQSPDLAQNYPNPFNPVTTIRYQVPHASRIRVSVFNLIGKEIAALVDSYKLPGYYQVQWNASGASSGIYFCTMVSSRFTKTTKLLLLK